MARNNIFDCIIVGAGIFGVTTALEMHGRGYQVALFDSSPLSHLRAASADISKVVRMEYGSDATYMAMAEQAYIGWLQWNEDLGDAFFHEEGVAMLTRALMSAGSFEYESYQLLLQRGHYPERLSSLSISERFPAWKPGAYVDDFFHTQGGYVESDRLLEALLRLAQAQGIMLHVGETVDTLLKESHHIMGIRTRSGSTFSAEQVVVTCGVWTPLLVPDLNPILRIVGQPIFYLKPTNPAYFTSPYFPVFFADGNRTGWYGFPFHPHKQVVKIAHDGNGQLIDPQQDECMVTPTDVERLRTFLAATFPELEAAPIVATRCCLYADTADGDFWIDRHPHLADLVVASGDSGHAFKFAPILGSLIADAVEGKPNLWLPKFRWRDLSWQMTKKEASRYQGEE